MRESQDRKRREKENDFAQHIGNRAARKQHARDTTDYSLWDGLGAMGTIGWTVGLPTLLGVLLGAWIDTVWLNSPVSWTLILLIGGLLFGIGSAWRWIEGERKEIEQQEFRQEQEEEQDNFYDE